MQLSQTERHEEMVKLEWDIYAKTLHAEYGEFHPLSRHPAA